MVLFHFSVTVLLVLLDTVRPVGGLVAYTVPAGGVVTGGTGVPVGPGSCGGAPMPWMARFTSPCCCGVSGWLLRYCWIASFAAVGSMPRPTR